MLTWKQVYGSGTNLTLTEVMGLPLKQFFDWLEWMQAQRQREADALRRGSGKKRG